MDIARALRLFSRIVETGSMAAAAREIGMAQPAASKLLRRFEAHCGARLLERAPTGMRPTEHGRGLYERSGAALSTIDAAILSVQEAAAEIGGQLKVHSPACLGERHLVRIANAFRERHPAVGIELILGNHGVDLARDGVDLAFGLNPPSGLDVVSRRIGTARRVLAASPDYLATRGAIDGPQDLAQSPMIVTDAALDDDDALALVGPSGPVAVRVTPAIRTNSVQILLNAMLEGRGVGAAQVLLIADELADGRLVRVLPDHEVRPTDIHLSYPSARLLRPAVRAFVDFAAPAVRRIEGVT